MSKKSPKSMRIEKDNMLWKNSLFLYINIKDLEIDKNIPKNTVSSLNTNRWKANGFAPLFLRPSESLGISPRCLCSLQFIQGYSIIFLSQRSCFRRKCIVAAVLCGILHKKNAWGWNGVWMAFWVHPQTFKRFLYE